MPYSDLAVTVTGSLISVVSDFYTAEISVAGANKGILRNLYIQKAGGAGLSSNVLYYAFNTTNPYGLGWLEGSGSGSYGNTGIVGVGATVTLTLNTAAKVIVTVTNTIGNSTFSNAYTFYNDQAWFSAYAVATRVTAAGVPNQYQFCDMINPSLTAKWFGLDADGSIRSIPLNVRRYMPVGSPYLGKHPYINIQFTVETVSLGMVYAGISDRLATNLEIGDWSFETQMNHVWGGGSKLSPVDIGQSRTLTTYYYTTNAASNTSIDTWATARWAAAASNVIASPVTQAAGFYNNAQGQATGHASAIVNSPFLIMRQNAFRSGATEAYTPVQYDTGIFGPMFGITNPATVNTLLSSSYVPTCLFQLGYDNDTTNFPYGAITASNVVNRVGSPALTSIQHDAPSSDAAIAYSTVWRTWADSDKLSAVGTASGVAAVAKDIYLALITAMPVGWQPMGVKYMATDATNYATVTVDALTQNDNKWTDYSNSGNNGYMAMIYHDNSEDPPALVVPIKENGTYHVIASVLRVAAGNIIYRYSVDGAAYSSFTVTAGTAGPVEVDLGNLVLTNGNIWMAGDGNAGAGVNGWAGWVGIRVLPNIVDLGSGVYDIQFADLIHGNVGVAVKLGFTPAAVSITATGLYLYLYQNATQQALANFSYPFDVQFYPHKGFLTDPAQFTALHTVQTTTYDDRGIVGSDGDGGLEQRRRKRRMIIWGRDKHRD